MSITPAASSRDAAASEREASRVFAAEVAARRSAQRHDMRVQEAKDADAPRPRERRPDPERVVDVLA